MRRHYFIVDITKQTSQQEPCDNQWWAEVDQTVTNCYFN